MIGTGTTLAAEVRRRRLAAARWTLASTVPVFVLAVAVTVFERADLALLGGVLLALVLLPAVRAATITTRGRGHFQPFQLVLLAAASLVQAVAAAAALGSGALFASMALGLWALATANAVRLVQGSQLVT